MNYQRNLKLYKDMNLADAGVVIPLDTYELSEEAKEELRDKGYDTWINNGFIDVWATDVAKFHSDDIIENFISSESYIDEDERRYILNSLMGNYNHYLVVATSHTWDGRTGFRIASSIDDAIWRDDYVTLIPHSVSKGGKCLCLTESSHDVPMGSNTYIIGLTDVEYSKLKYADVDSYARFAAKYYV